MKVEILNIHNRGKPNEEFALLRAKADCDIGDYILADSTYSPAGNISSKLRHAFFFPNKRIRRNHLVVLRTGTGEDGEFINSNGDTVHRFFWGLKRTVWNDDQDCALLAEVSAWAYKVVP